MASIIPKINIGKSSHRNKFDLSCMTHTTSEVGYMQPMFSKILSPHTTIKIGTKSLVRLSSMFVPTMGKLDLRFYHAFVPLNTVWTPFDAFLTGTDFTLADGSQYRPTVAPSFRLKEVFDYLSVSQKVGSCPNVLWHTDIDMTRYSQKMACYSELYNRWFNQDSNQYFPQFLFNQLRNSKSKFCFFGMENGFIIDNDSMDFDGIPTIYEESDYLYCWYNPVANKVTCLPYYSAGEFTTSDESHLGSSVAGPIPEPQSSDWSLALDSGLGGSETMTAFTSYSLFSVRMRRLRKVFIGLGYSFNPFDNEQQTPFKLMAYYKAWYQLFYPQRDSNFFATNCYKLTKFLSENGITTIDNTGSNIPAFSLFIQMLDDLCDIRYILPLDYFSLADPYAETRGLTTGNFDGFQYDFNSVLHRGYVHGNDTDTLEASVTDDNGDLDSYPPSVTSYVSGNGGWSSASALAMRTAMKLMRFINKNTVVGKKVTDILRMRFGVSDTHEQAHEAVYLVGSSKVDINISDVMCTSPTDTMELGDYAGKGIGFGESKYFTFDSGANTGVFITFAAIVPMTGYFQGMLRENSFGVNDRFDFYSPEFDALGYDDIRYNELVSDLMHDDTIRRAVVVDQPQIGTNLGSIGYVPRYTSLKVSKDICNGDISLHSREDSMLPYTLDRHFGALPDMTPENFRSLSITDFNRIFNSKSSWDDHFIIQTMFDVSMWADMKSIANTFDTFDDDGDTGSIEMEHQ